MHDCKQLTTNFQTTPNNNTKMTMMKEKTIEENLSIRSNDEDGDNDEGGDDIKTEQIDECNHNLMTTTTAAVKSKDIQNSHFNQWWFLMMQQTIYNIQTQQQQQHVHHDPSVPAPPPPLNSLPFNTPIVHNYFANNDETLMMTTEANATAAAVASNSFNASNLTEELNGDSRTSAMATAAAGTAAAKTSLIENKGQLSMDEQQPYQPLSTLYGNFDYLTNNLCHFYKMFKEHKLQHQKQQRSRIKRTRF